MAGVKVLLVATVVSVLISAAWCRGLQLPQLFDCPPTNPFCPVWVPCNYTEVQGATCQDCHTRVICTPVGGLVRPCAWPLRPNCVEGACSSKPSEDCLPPPPPEPETTTTEETDTTGPEEIETTTPEESTTA